MKIIPAIDIIGGKCVRLTQGDYNQSKVYNENPLEAAKEFEDAGITHLHLVDLDGAKAQHIVNYQILSEITSKTNLKIDFGGGLKSDEDLKIAFENGASQITGGSIAVKNPELFYGWINKYGSDKIILGADCKNKMIAVSGWKEETNREIIPFIDLNCKQGITFCICTDISRDGMLEGCNIDLYREILQNNPQLQLIASGGVSSMKDITDLAALNLFGVVVGKAIYEKRISLNEIRKFNS
jgi:phosphoribosylformimino-5-aminoimidazole carboxamide ribotide isomerase